MKITIRWNPGDDDYPIEAHITSLLTSISPTAGQRATLIGSSGAPLVVKDLVTHRAPDGATSVEMEIVLLPPPRCTARHDGFQCEKGTGHVGDVHRIRDSAGTIGLFSTDEADQGFLSAGATGPVCA